jgi:3-phenylpropionate/trans-cinnamate dioxygenase ferredoxin subunit
MSGQWHAVARVGALRSGDVIAVEVAGVEMALGRDGDHYFAVQRRCAHLRGDLADGIIARGHLVCPQHGWRFSTATGRHDQEAQFCLVTYPVRVTGDRIEIDPRPRRPS